MKTGLIVSGICLGLATMAVGTTRGHQAIDARNHSARRTAAGYGTRNPVLIELFTSEGCSSCPSADKLMAELAASQSVEGAEIIALEEHVDYWNRIGWDDPFSSAKFTQRQYAYGTHFRLENVYTPQAVVDGMIEFVGSDRSSALSSVQSSAHLRKTEIQIKLAGDDGKQLKVEVSAASLPAGTEQGEVLLAVAEDKLRVHVASGENSGRNLVHQGVVRHFVSLGMTHMGKPFMMAATIPLASRWTRDNLRAVAFIQSPDSKRILGLGTLKLAAAPKG